MAGDDLYLVGERQEAVVDGAEELVGVASGQIRATDRAREEGVSSEQEGLGGEVEADGALSVSGSVEDGAGEGSFARTDGDELAVIEGVVRGVDGGGWDT